MSELKSSRSLTKGSLIYSVGNIGTLIINFFLVPLYTFFLSTDELGYFDVVASSLVVVAPLFFGHIELAVLRWILANKTEENIRKVVSNCAVIFLAGTLLFGVVYFLSASWLKWELPLYVFIYFLGNFFHIIGKQLIRSVFSSLHYVATEIIYTLVVLLCIIFMVEELKLKAIFLAYGLASAILFSYLLILGIWRKIDLKEVGITPIRELLGYSAPLIPNTFSVWLNNMSSKYLIVFFIGMGANGIFAIAFKFAYVLQILNGIFYFSFQDKMFEIYGQEGYGIYFTETFNKYISVLFAFLFLLIGTQNLVLPWVVDDAFLEATSYIPVLGFGVLFMCLATIIGIIYQCEKKNLNASKTSFVSGVSIVLLGLWAIPEFGLYGATAAFMIGNFILLLYRYFDTQKYIAKQINILSFGSSLIIALGLWVLSSYSGLVIQLITFILALLAAGFTNRAILKMYYHRLRIKFRT